MIKPFHFILLLAITLPSAAFAQMSAAPVVEGSNPMRVIFGLLLVLAVIGAFAWVMKRMNYAKIGGHSVAKIVGGVNVGARERVVVVEVAGHWIVTGVTAGQINSLASFKLSELENTAPTQITTSANAISENDLIPESELAVQEIVASKSFASIAKERFRFEPHSHEVDAAEALSSMANPALTALFKRLLKK